MKPFHIVIFCLVISFVFVVSPGTVTWIGYFTYLSLGLLIARSALRDRSAGWICGLTLALLILFLPLWVFGAYALFQGMTKNVANSITGKGQPSEARQTTIYSRTDKQTAALHFSPRIHEASATLPEATMKAKFEVSMDKLAARLEMINSYAPLNSGEIAQLESLLRVTFPKDLKVLLSRQNGSDFVELVQYSSADLKYPIGFKGFKHFEPSDPKSQFGILDSTEKARQAVGLPHSWVEIADSPGSPVFLSCGDNDNGCLFIHLDEESRFQRIGSSLTEFIDSLTAQEDSFDLYEDDHPALSAAYRGDLAQLDEYLDSGLSVNFEGEHGETLLVAAGRRPSMVRYLIGRGANVNRVNKRGDTTLHRIAGIGPLDTERELLEHGANPNALDAKGNTPLDRCWQQSVGVRFRRREELLLKSFGARLAREL